MTQLDEPATSESEAAPTTVGAVIGCAAPRAGGADPDPGPQEQR